MEQIGTNPNRRRLVATAQRLVPVLDKLVFVGGNLVDVLVTDPAAYRMRPTDDVDVIVACVSRGHYHALLSTLRQLGFAPDTREGAPVCRTRTADGPTIRIASAPSFFVTKWEAFWQRGAADPFGSHDLEDLIMLVAAVYERFVTLHAHVVNPTEPQ